MNDNYENYDNMSMSMMLETRKQIFDTSIPKISPSIWIPSNNITHCYGCSTQFTMWNRKHHCRICGRIFCNACTTSRGRISSLVNITTPPNKSFSLSNLLEKNEEKRMCEGCKKKTDFINKSSEDIYIFANLPIVIVDFYNLRLVCKKWCKSINTIISFYKGIQYKLPSQKFSKLERTILWTHRKEFSGHYHLMTRCMSSITQSYDISNVDKIIDYYRGHGQLYTCKELGCKRNCSSVPKIEEILELTYRKNVMANRNARIWIINELKKRTSYENKNNMPWLVKIAREYNDIGSESIIPNCVIDIQLTFAFYYECKFQMLDPYIEKKLYPLFNRFYNLLDKETRMELEKCDNFIQFINYHVKNNVNINDFHQKIIRWFDKYKYVLLPWNPKIKCINILTEGIAIIRSSTKPWKIPLLVIDNEKQRIVNLLVKLEDVRKDKLTMIVASWIERICNDYVNIKKYDVFPIDTDTGWIEMVDHTSTLYDIKHKYQSSLLNFIMDLNPNYTVKQLREKFVTTCVSSCVLCYVLGVGDRHMENILVTKDGELLHIDFSYLLGDDPKHVQVEMKITEDMLDMLGGSGSITFNQFKNKCKEAYKLIRRRSSLWYILLTYLSFARPGIKNYQNDFLTIKNHVIERLIPGENEEEASMQIINIVERSTKSDWGDQLSEWTHELSNQAKSLGNVMRSTIFTMD